MNGWHGTPQKKAFSEREPTFGFIVLALIYWVHGNGDSLIRLFLRFTDFVRIFLCSLPQLFPSPGSLPVHSCSYYVWFASYFVAHFFPFRSIVPTSCLKVRGKCVLILSPQFQLFSRHFYHSAHPFIERLLLRFYLICVSSLSILATPSGSGETATLHSAFYVGIQQGKLPTMPFLHLPVLCLFDVESDHLIWCFSVHNYANLFILITSGNQNVCHACHVFLCPSFHLKPSQAVLDYYQDQYFPFRLSFSYSQSSFSLPASSRLSYLMFLAPPTSACYLGQGLV